MLQQALRRGPPYPMVLTRPDDEFWVDGTEHETPLDARGDPVLPQHTWKPKIECDETAKCYRRHFLGKVSGRCADSPADRPARRRAVTASGRWSPVLWTEDLELQLTHT